MGSVALKVQNIFTAVDKLTGPVRKMQSGVTQFTNKAAMGFAKVQRAERKVRQGISKMIGKLGQLGLAFSALMIIQTVAKANIELDASLASLQAITGVTNTEFVGFTEQVGKVAKAQKEFAGETAKAFEIVASAQPILLKDAEALGKVTNAAITLSKASGDDLATAAGNLTGVMNQFSLGAEHAERVMNSLAAGSVAGSANITNVALSMKNFGAVASAANLSVEESIALVEVMGSKSIFAEEAGTALRATILRLQKAGVGYQSGLFNINDALEEVRKKSMSYGTALERDNYLQKVFGARQITTGQILLNNIGMLKDLTGKVTGKNTAVDQMITKANTLKNRLLEVKNAFLNTVTTTDQTSKSLNGIKKVLLFVSDNMEKIIKVIGILVTAYATLKVTMAIVTAAQWAFNAATWANPVTWITLAIVALVAVIALLIIKWKDITNWVKTSDSFFAKLIRFSLIPIIVIFKLIKLAWDKISAAFKKREIGAAIKAIGMALLNFALAPLEAILKVVNKVTRGKVGGGALEKITNTRAELKTGFEENATKVINARAEIEKQKIEVNNKTTRNDKVEIGVTATNGTKAEILGNSGANVSLTNTLGFQPG